MENQGDALVGEILTHIDVDADNEEILLTTQSGRRFRVYHNQNCCENVNIVDTEGEWHTLLNKKLVEVKHTEYDDGVPPYDGCESYTKTAILFRVDDATVISRWVGTSNGYYSETVDLAEI